MLSFIFDVETSGLTPNRTLRLEKQPEIIEIYGAIIDIDTGEQFEEIDTLIKPKTSVDEESKAHKKVGITNEMLANSQTFETHAGRIRELIERSQQVISHNISFDTEMLEIEYERMRWPIREWPEKICTVEQTVWLKGYRMKLGDLHEYLFNKKFDGAHRAKVDVQALIRCCIELRKRGVI